jgi:hypothetical protein
MAEEKNFNMTDEDVEREQKNLLKANPESLNKIYHMYKITINSLLNLAKEQAKHSYDEDDIIALEQLERIIRLCPIEEIFIRSKEKIFGYRDKIINKDADYFIKKDYGQFIKKDRNQYMLETLVSVIRTRFNELNEKEKNIYWAKAATMLKCVLEFKLLINDHS